LNEVTGGAGPLTPDNYAAALKKAFGEQGGGGLALVYQPSAYMNNAGLAMAAAGTDAVFSCPALRAADTLAANGKVFGYEFNDPKAPQIFLPPVPDIEYGAAHASELQYLFILPKSTLAPEQMALADTMVKYWTNFAKTGDPNGADVPAWPAYMKGAGNFQNLAPGAGAIAPVQGFSMFHKCDLIDPQM
jgi:para-nitrobenzyl esterase